MIPGKNNHKQASVAKPMFKIPFYRGKDVITGDWVTGMPIEDADIKGRWYIMHKFSDGLDKVEVRPETITAYSDWETGQGQDIFAGDICKLTNHEGQTIKVTCKYGTVIRPLVNGNNITHTCEIKGFYFEDEQGNPTFPIAYNYLGLHDTWMMEVIGDIFDGKDHLNIALNNFIKELSVDKTEVPGVYISKDEQTKILVIDKPDFYKSAIIIRDNRDLLVINLTNTIMQKSMILDEYTNGYYDSLEVKEINDSLVVVMTNDA